MNATRMTHSASCKILELMQEEENLELMLRVFIQGGGCSGFKYGFSFEVEKNADDYSCVSNVVKIAGVSPELIKLYAISQLISQQDFRLLSLVAESFSKDLEFTINKVTLVVDPISVQYLKNAVIDYKTGIEGEYFTVINPDAKTTCGCGSSFSIDTSTAA